MNLYYVYKKDYDQYSENRGTIVLTNNSNRAKGIAMSRMNWEGYPKKDILVDEIDSSTEGVICMTDYVHKRKVETNETAN